MEATVHHIEQTTSTQWEARRLIQAGEADIGDIVLADEQTAGRGRLGRSWISPQGGLYSTIIAAHDQLIWLRAGLAVVYVLQSAGLAAGLKWPNDVMVEGGKIAGLLIETDGQHSLVGIGINLKAAPLDTATCVAHYADIPDRRQLAQEIAKKLQEPTLRETVLHQYRTMCLTIGTPVRIERMGDDMPVEGIAAGIEEDGRLIIRTSSGNVTVSSGQCFHVRGLKKGHIPFSEFGG